MGYLIPKSARNVKMQLFKGLGIVEAVMVIVAAIVGVVIFQTAWNMVVKVVVIGFIGFLTLYMVSPSFIVNKKGYQSFDVMFTYMSQEKYYKKKSVVKKHGK
jgi:phosphatidylserine synthase